MGWEGVEISVTIENVQDNFCKRFLKLPKNMFHEIGRRSVEGILCIVITIVGV